MGFYISEILVVFMRFSPASRQGEKGKKSKRGKGKINLMDLLLGT